MARLGVRPAVLEAGVRRSARIAGEKTALGACISATTKSFLPSGDSSAKTVFGVYSDDELVGVIDPVDGFPVPTTAMLGLLLIAGTHRRRGIGARAARAVEDLVLSWGTCDRIRIGVVRTNAQALIFWEAVGYSATGELRPYEEGVVLARS
ncbi:MAG: GNAT family N-acetyltransferase [Coriobacteriia bacterium]|nr:GNAT family N-acetyltransferase [Coriobacteriia bacterium]